MYKLEHFRDYGSFKIFIDEVNQLRHIIINFVKDSTGYTVLYKE